MDWFLTHPLPHVVFTLVVSNLLLDSHLLVVSILRPRLPEGSILFISCHR